MRAGRGQRQGSGVPRWIKLSWIGVIFAALGLIAPAAQASYYDAGGTQLHINSLHYRSVNGTNGPGPQDEQFCAQVWGSSYLTHNQASSFLQETLVELADSRTWDGLGSYRVDLWLEPEPCTSYPADARSSIELEYHYAGDWSNKCGGPAGYYNCAVRWNPVYNSDYGHTDYQGYYLYMVDSSGGQLDAGGRAFINHETGHALGLTHPVNCSAPSLMYSTVVGYSCSNWTNWWPSPSDFNQVTAVMNGV